MGLPVLKRSRFLEDYTGIVLTIQEANPRAAHRFCDEVEEAIKLISTHPEIARKAGFPKAPEARIWPVRRYPNYVILYRVTPTDVVFLRLLHGARDLPPLVPTSDACTAVYALARRQFTKQFEQTPAAAVQRSDGGSRSSL